MSQLTLVPLSPAYYEALAQYRAQYQAAGLVIHGGSGLGSVTDFAKWQAALERGATWEGVQPGLVPAELWLVVDTVDDRLIGLTNLRLELNDYLRSYGGNIGYSIALSEWGKGYGTQALALTLERAKAHGISRVLITCDERNIGSQRVIEKNGGVLESKQSDGTDGEIVCRYWITLD